MLVARPSKRRGAELLSTDLRFDILDGERQLGALACRRGDLGAEITLEGRTYTVEHTPGTESEMLYQAAVRVAAGRPKPAPGRFDLRDAAGAVLADAEQTGEAFRVTRGAERFGFAKGRSRLLFNLVREADAAPLGAVGQRRFWTTRMHMDLPDGFDPPFQVFLLTLLLGVIVQRSAAAASFN